MDRNNQLLSFLYQTPVAIIETDARGTVGLMNAMAAQYLLPLTGGKKPENLFALLEPYVPDLEERVENYVEPRGELFNRRRVECRGRHYHFDLKKVGTDTFMAVLADITEEVEREQRLQEAIAKEAEERGRREIAAGVLHDIGNAVTALGTGVARALGELDWQEPETLEQLKRFLLDKREALSAGLGQEQSQTVIDLIGELAREVDKRKEETRESLDRMAGTLSHVSEILTIQRAYTAEQSGVLANVVDLRRVVDDALDMQATSLAGREISVFREYPEVPAMIRGDRTNLVRVVMNLVRNSAEAFDRISESGQNRSIRLTVLREEAVARVYVEDNGPGFEDAEGSSKGDAGGLGLKGVAAVVKAHGGDLSSGRSELGGARVEFWLPMEEDMSGE